MNDAYAYCERLAREHYENFPVASRLLPRRMRPHIAAIYAFARIADDIADEGDDPPAQRLRRLEAWRRRLHTTDTSTTGAHGYTRTTEGNAPHAEVFVALRHTIAECRLPVSLFDDLISAFVQDVTVKQYATWADVLDYCRRSANPIGRLVLRVAGRDDAGLDAASDALCTALQLTNFWQDFAIDWGRGRLYVSADVWQPPGARLSDLEARRLTPEWRAALAEASRRTRALFARGRGVCDGVDGRLRWELRATWLGGVRVLDRFEASRYDVFGSRPVLSAADVPAILTKMVTWRTSRPAPVAPAAASADRGVARK